MATFVYNIAQGRIAELYYRVKNNQPTGSALVCVVITTSASDATLKKKETLAAVLDDVSTAEVLNVGYERRFFYPADIAGWAPDHVGDQVELHIPDIKWDSVSVYANTWKDILVCYDPDPKVTDDTKIIPLTQHDIANMLGDSNDLEIVWPVDGFFKA